MADGILIVDKPSEWTSFDVVAKLRRVFNTKKIGHTGTLDPMATGVLCVFLGSATRFISHIPNKDKRYTAEVTFGYSTDTGDVTGVVNDRCGQLPDVDLVHAALPQFIGEIDQIPPKYSAVKVDGQPLYKAARSGREVVIPSRRVRINNIELLSCTEKTAVLDVSCGEGTYIRTLAEDIAKRCGTLATLSALCRTESGVFKLTDSVSLTTVVNSDNPELFLLPVERCFTELSTMEIDDIRLKRLTDGLTQNVPNVHGLHRAYHDGVFVGLVSGDGEKIKAVRMCQY